MGTRSSDRARTSTDQEIAGVTRRRFLRGLGGSAVGAGAYAVAGGPATLGGHIAGAQSGPSQSPLNFGRMFPGLPPFAPDGPALRAALTDIGKPGGILDAHDNLAAGPVELILDPALSVNNPNNATHTAGTTFLGQFLDHDVTFDAASPLGVPTEPRTSRNTADALARPRFALRRGADRLAAALPSGPDQASHRERRAVRGPPARRRRASGHFGSAQRREPDHRRIAGRVHQVPQRGRGHRAGRAAHPAEPRLHRGPPPGDMALPVDRRAGVPAADPGAVGGGRHPAPRAAGTTGRRSTGRSCPSSSRAPPTGSGTA